MVKLGKFLTAALLPLGMMMFTSAEASAIQTTCTLDSFRLTSIKAGGAGPNLLSQSYDASACVGLFGGGNDDAGGLSEPNPNTGVYNEGILNGEGDLFDGLEFIEAVDLQDIDGVGGMNDPGWIHVAHMNALTVGFDSVGAVNLNDLFNLSFICTNDSAGDCKGGDWSFEVKATAFDLVKSVLGPNSFDNLALSIKAGNAFAVYNLDFDEIFGEEDNPALNFSTAYTFAGTFNTLDFGRNGKGVSHMNLWVRDPVDAVPPPPEEVPEPAAPALFGLGLVALSLAARRKARKTA